MNLDIRKDTNEGTTKVMQMEYFNVNKFTAQFLFEKTTKNTVRYMEIPQEGKTAFIGTLYVQKSALPAELPKFIEVDVKWE